jgi:hypothetical protein
MERYAADVRINRLAEVGEMRGLGSCRCRGAWRRFDAEPRWVVNLR